MKTKKTKKAKSVASSRTNAGFHYEESTWGSYSGSVKIDKNVWTFAAKIEVRGVNDSKGVVRADMVYSADIDIDITRLNGEEINHTALYDYDIIVLKAKTLKAALKETDAYAKKLAIDVINMNWCPDTTDE